MPAGGLLGRSGESPLLVNRRHISVTIGSAALKNSFSTPISILPGVSGCWIVVCVFTYIKFADVAYVLNGNTNLNLRWNAANAFQTLPLAGQFDTVAQTWATNRWASNLNVRSGSNPTVVGAGLELTLDTANMVTGDGDVKIGMTFDVIPQDIGTY